jgi:chromosome segregation ATPase
MTMTSRNADITYDQFAQVAAKLQTETQKIPSVRAIQHLIGGSSITVAKYLRQWKEEIAHASLVDDTIPAHLKQALLATIGEATQKTRETLEAQLKQERQQTEEAYELLKEAEARITELYAQHQADEEKYTQSEKKLAAERSLTTELRRNIEKLEGLETALRKKVEVEAIQTANAKSLLESAEKALTNTTQKIDSLQQKVEVLQKELHEAQLTAAVATTRLEEKQRIK